VSRPVVAAVAQAFKGSLDAAEVATVLEHAIRGVGATPRVVRGSDGGDGLLDALNGLTVRRSQHPTEDSLGRPLTVPIDWLDESTAVIESRLSCGVALLAVEERDPLRTSTRGVGVLVQAAVSAGARTVYVGLGGSATMDGGVGMARAWGWVPRDAAGRELPEGGGGLRDLERFDPGAPPQAGVIGLCDVSNPLLGTRGARAYARQKGATPVDEDQLAEGLARLADVMGQGGPGARGSQPGAGAAGGLGFGILEFARGRLEPGAAWVLDRVGFGAALSEADLVLVVEGAFDRTSLEGKLTGVAMSRARAAGIGIALAAPSATDVPDDVPYETGGGQWGLAELERRAGRAVERALRLLRAR
jgi:glycerate kinase